MLTPETRAACHGDHQAIITALIDAGFLQSCGFMIDGYLCDSASRIRDAVNAYIARQQITPDGCSAAQDAHGEQEGR